MTTSSTRFKSAITIAIAMGSTVESAYSCSPLLHSLVKVSKFLVLLRTLSGLSERKLKHQQVFAMPFKDIPYGMGAFPNSLVLNEFSPILSSSYALEYSPIVAWSISPAKASSYGIHLSAVSATSSAIV